MVQGFRVKCKPLIKKAPPFQRLNLRIPIIILQIQARGFINQGSGLRFTVLALRNLPTPHESLDCGELPIGFRV